MKLRLCISIITALACLWSLAVLLNAKVLMGQVLIIAKNDAISLMVAQVVIVPCVIWLALRKPVVR